MAGWKRSSRQALASLVELTAEGRVHALFRLEPAQIFLICLICRHTYIHQDLVDGDSDVPRQLWTLGILHIQIH